MAKRGGSFSFAKRQKELARQKKKKEKLERKRQKAAGQDPDLTGDEEPAEDSDTPIVE